MSLREERNPPPPPEPMKPLTPEEITGKLAAHDQKLSVSQKFNVLLTIAVILLAAVLWLRTTTTKTPAVVHPNATDSLTVRVDSLGSAFRGISTKTESGQINQVMNRLNEVEETAVQSGIDARRAEAAVTQHRLTGK